MRQNIKFLNKFVRKLTKYKFSNAKALHVAAQLVRQFFSDIYVPRIGVSKYFKAGDMKQIMAAYLRSVLRSLTTAKEFKTVGFADLSIVSSEITKFLPVNTGVRKGEERVGY